MTDTMLALSTENSRITPLHAGDEVVAQLTIEKVRNRGTTDMVTVSVDLRTAAGETICTATSQLMHTRPEGASA